MFTSETLREELSKPKQIVITTHHKPDGDALGSSLAVYHWLKAKGHDVHVVVPSAFPAILDWMPERENIMVYTANKADNDVLIANADIIYCLDFNGLSRIHAMADRVKSARAVKIMIDHHLDPEGFDDYRHWDSNAAATAQLVYDFMVHVMGDHDAI